MFVKTIFCYGRHREETPALNLETREVLLPAVPQITNLAVPQMTDRELLIEENIRRHLSNDFFEGATPETMVRIREEARAYMRANDGEQITLSVSPHGESMLIAYTSSRLQEHVAVYEFERSLSGNDMDLFEGSIREGIVAICPDSVFEIPGNREAYGLLGDIVIDRMSRSLMRHYVQMDGVSRATPRLIPIHIRMHFNERVTGSKIFLEMTFPNGAASRVVYTDL